MARLAARRMRAMWLKHGPPESKSCTQRQGGLGGSVQSREGGPQHDITYDATGLS